MKLLILIGMSLGLLSCGQIQRHPKSGYYDGYADGASTPQDFYIERQAHEREIASTSVGLAGTTALTEEEQKRLGQRLELTRLEQRLNSTRERRQYYGSKPFFNDDQQRIEFLKLPSVEARERYLISRGITSSPTDYPPNTLEAIENSDIILGMSRKAVRESWGDPDVVEVAGDPLYGNERWQYAKMMSSSEGYTKEMRIIYFESGRVVGWEKQ